MRKFIVLILFMFLGSLNAYSASTTTSSGAASGGDDDAGQSLETVYSQIAANVKSLTAKLTLVQDPTAQKSLTSSFSIYSENRGSCITRQKIAAYACLENLSPIISDATTAINTIAAAVTTSVNDACSSFSKAMTIAQAAMTTYTAECGVMKANCGWSCSSAKKGLESLKASLGGTPSCRSQGCDLASYTKLKTETLKLIEQELTAKVTISVAGKNQICTEKYAALLVSGVAGIASIANALKQGKSCDEETSASSETTTAEKCAIEANAALPECICLANPLLEGCSSITADSGTSTLSATSATGTTATASSGLTSSDLDTSSGSSIASGTTASSDSSTGTVGGASGGASLGGMSSGGSSSGGSSDASKSGRSLNTSVLAGTEGTGSGGGFWGTGSASDKNGYRSYLPGGSRDPSKAAGTDSTAIKEVTSQGGKSNWEKVSDRYRDNRNTLIDQ
ncbi:MAG: hypothetical protein J7501_01605 [Bdellovibrio sp.]|nr:hypothetical protein [Bdellovibrio sp.]